MPERSRHSNEGLPIKKQTNASNPLKTHPKTKTELVIFDYIIRPMRSGTQKHMEKQVKSANQRLNVTLLIQPHLKTFEAGRKVELAGWMVSCVEIYLLVVVVVMLETNGNDTSKEK